MFVLVLNPPPSQLRVDELRRFAAALNADWVVINSAQLQHWFGDEALLAETERVIAAALQRERRIVIVTRITPHMAMRLKTRFAGVRVHFFSPSPSRANTG